MITSEFLVVCVLIGLNVFQLMWWSRQVQKLVDKVMSKNFYDYKLSETIPEQKPSIKPDVSFQMPPEGELEDLRVLNGLT